MKTSDGFGEDRGDRRILSFIITIKFEREQYNVHQLEPSTKKIKEH